MIKKLLAFQAVLLAAFAVTGFVYAEGEADDPGATGGLGCGSYDHTGGDCSVVWYRYTYNSNATSANPQTWIPGATNGSTLWGEAGNIGKVGDDSNDSCRGVSTTFYAKGIAMTNTNVNTSVRSTIYGNSQQFGMANPTLKAVYTTHAGDSTHAVLNGSAGNSYAFSKKIELTGSLTSNGFSGNAIARSHNDATIVASGSIVTTEAAHNAFCLAATDNETDLEACKSNNTTTLTTSNGNFTFQGDSNPASWFCANDKILSKEENLDSTSTVNIRDASHNDYANASANDGETRDGSPATAAPSGDYEYLNTSTVYSADSSVRNKIAFTDDMCRSAGGLMRFSGEPSVNDSAITGSPAGSDNSTKCSYSAGYTGFKLFPGQTKTFSASVSHPSRIKKTSSTIAVADGSATETSSAKITLRADPIKCWGDDNYQIGNGNFTNYYRLGLGNDNSFEYTKIYPYTYIDDKKEVTLFAKPGDKIQFKYDFCGGGVLKDDIDGVANDAIKAKNYYTIGSDSSLSDKAWIWDASDTKIASMGISGSSFGDSATNRISNNYTYSTSSPNSHKFKIEDGSELIGSTISNSLGVTSGEVKIPYNYYINPSYDLTSTGYLGIGSKLKLTASTSVGPRMNLQPQINSSYMTTVKANTRVYAWIFTLPETMTADTLESAVGTSTIDGDYYYQGGEGDLPINKMPAEANPVSYEELAINESKELSYEVGSNEKIGTKVCSMVAVWPADSHNLLNVDSSGNGQYDIPADSAQENALRKDAGTNPYWRYSLDCRTVGKYPTVSIEGASLVASGEASTSKISYGNGIFGSWAEYDLVASKANNMGSGASLAYAISEPQTDINQAGNYSIGGLRDGATMTPQTLGGLALDYGSSDEAAKAMQLSKKFAENIKSYCYDSTGSSSGNCEVAENITSVDDAKNGFILYRPTNSDTIEIAQNISNDSKGAIVVIYGKKVTISNNVTRIDAVIIAEEGLDTCSEDSHHKNSGNEELLTKCSNPLTINGAVYTKGDADLMLDRVYGGGSTEDGETLNPDTLMQRAEIFNYDPRITKVSQDIIDEMDVTDVQYIKELAPRY